MTKTFALLALSAAAVIAAPQRNGHAHFHGTGFRGTGWALPTGTGGASHTTFNETGFAGPTSVPSISFQTVSEATAVAAVTSAEDTTTCTTYFTSTEYATSVQYLTVTAGPGRSVSVETSTSSAASISVSSVAAGAFFNNPKSASTTSVVATTLVTSAVTSSAATTSAVVSGSTAKKGLAYNSASLLSLFSGSGASWAYDWGLTAGGSVPSGVEYVPMCWGANQAPGCAASVIASGAQHVLSFNEPDMGSQANMAVDDAVAKHIQYIAIPLAKKVTIGSPAVTSDVNSARGLGYMDAFLKKCGVSCAIDFMAIHWYGDASQIGLFTAHVADAVTLAASHNISRVWVTEFAATGSSAAQVTFLQKAVAYLDSNPSVERYSYFMVGSADGFGMVDGSALNAVGKAYAA